VDLNSPNPFGAPTYLGRLVRRYLWTVPVIALLAVIIGLFDGLGVSLLIPFLSILAKTTPASGAGALALLQKFGEGYGRNGRIILICTTILGCILVKSVLQIVANVTAAWIDVRVGHDIRTAISSKLQNVQYEFFLSQDAARLVDIFTVESWKASDAVRLILKRIASTAAAAVVGVLLLLVSWRLTLLVVLGTMLMKRAQQHIEAKLIRRSMEVVPINQVLASRMLFAIFGSRLIRLFHTQKYEHERFTSASANVRDALSKVELLSGTLWPTVELMQGVLLVAVLIIAVLKGISLPLIITFLVLMNRLQPHLLSLEQCGAAFASAAGQLGEVEWLLSTPIKPSPPGDIPFNGLHDVIAFDNVTFEYGAGEIALSEANFVIRQGRSTALIGSSGAGKSTVVGLLCRLLQPSAGVITVDGNPLAHVNIVDWLNSIAIAGQDVDLIDGTISENVAYDRPDIGREKIYEALSEAEADFVRDLPRGLDTLVGARGLNLSGGQRQRIGIARAFARNASIFILDEATNAIDTEAEAAILATLHRLPREKTIIVVSHRESTLAMCQDAIVFSRGRVVTEGPVSSVSERAEGKSNISR
jgi:subfamily B ATP-binding cassette protein MsbA